MVIDPGHGGDELGAQGPRGTLEKEITLAVSRRLRTLIESRLGLRVFLTREDDRTVPHDDRSAFANNHQADVFLSIHANAAVRPFIKGAEVYYLSVERADAEARKRAEDAAITLPALGGGTRDHRPDPVGDGAGAVPRTVVARWPVWSKKACAHESR